MNRTTWKGLASGLLVLAALGAGRVAGAEEAPPLRLLTPPDPEAPTVVHIDVYDLQVFSIQEQEEVFTVGGRLDLRWIDPRQAYDADAVGTWRLEYQGQAALDKIEKDVWWPDLEFVDAVDSRDRMAANLTIDSDGEIWYRERFNVRIKQDFYLGDFPYDEHVISFALEPFTYRSSAVRFVSVEGDVTTGSWEPTEWVVGEPHLAVSDGISHSCSGDEADSADAESLEGGCAGGAGCPPGTECEESVGFPRLTVSMDIARVSSSYTGNIILPLVLIVLVSSALFWMDLERTHLGDRLALAFTSLLTVVAFDFVTSSSLPKLWYATVLDRIVTLSYVFLTVMIAATVLADWLNLRGARGAERAAMLNRLLRWSFPAAFLVALAFLVLRAG